MSEFRVGDRIRIKTVDEMIESGLYAMHNDGCLHPTERLDNSVLFNGRMRYMCGRTGVITEARQISDIGYRYYVNFDDPETGQDGWILTDAMMCHDCDVKIDDGAVFAFLDSY